MCRNVTDDLRKVGLNVGCVTYMQLMKRKLLSNYSDRANWFIITSSTHRKKKCPQNPLLLFSGRRWHLKMSPSAFRNRDGQFCQYFLTFYWANDESINDHSLYHAKGKVILSQIFKFCWRNTPATNRGCCVFGKSVVAATPSLLRWQHLGKWMLQ